MQKKIIENLQNGGLLEKYKFPQDLKKLSYDQLDLLAAEIRELILEVVSKNGGHLAPNLGVVELTIALLRMLDLKKDKMVWDVGHQTYTFKILTDRLKSFHTVRKYKGISGFCRPSESVYDTSTSGHTSTSISSAMGVHVGNVLQGRKSKVVAVIGDGAMSGGMAFEALNNLSTLHKNIIVILNDNEMSIGENVGGIATHLSSILTSEVATKIKRDIQNIIEDAPLGDKLLSFAKKVESSVIGFMTPGSIFENLGIRYIGPVNGHKIKDIEKAISNAFLQDSPVLVHVATKKGKGYEDAENEPEAFHGIGAFDLATGIVCDKSTAPSWTKCFGKHIVEMAEKDKRIVAITAAMKDGTGLNEFADRFPDRFFDVGIAEQHAVTFCAGLATSGMRPYFAVYSTFLQRAYDQIIHDVAIACLPVVFCIDRGGLVGADGSTHHGAFDLGYLRVIPNIAVFLPKDDYELCQMLDKSLECCHPVAVRYARGAANSYQELPKNEVKIGEPELLASGDDVLIISVGHIFDEAYKVYKMLGEEKISASLINLRFLKPLNAEPILKEARGKKLIVTIEDGAVRGGGGEMLQALLSDSKIFIPFIKAGLPDEFIEHGSVCELRKSVGLDAESIFDKIKKTI